MSLRCTYINYTEDALLNIIKNKENREIAMRKTLSSVGGELIGYYGLIGQEYEVMMITKVDSLRDYMSLVAKAMLGGAVKDIKTGLVEIKNDKDGNLGSTIGRKSFSTEKLLENYNHFIESVKKEKPDTIKGEFIKNAFLTSTMGISYKVGAK